MAFCVWLLSLSIALSTFSHVVVSVRTSLQSNTQSCGSTTFYSPTCPLKDIGVVSAFCLSGRMPLRPFKARARAGRRGKEKGIHTIKGSKTRVWHGLYTENPRESPKSLLGSINEFSKV